LWAEGDDATFRADGGLVGTTRWDARQLVEAGQAFLTVAPDPLADGLGRGGEGPGGGFCLKNGVMYFRNNTNLIVRHARFRLGPNAGHDSTGNEFDTFNLYNTKNSIVDHCSASWSEDECLSVTNTSNNVTVQWCIISEGLNDAGHGYGSLIAPEVNSQMSWHHNLWAHQAGRNPRAGSRNKKTFLGDFVNNVIYNWGSSSGDFGAWAAYYSGEKIDMNWVNNYSIAGLDSTGKTTVVLSSGVSTSRIYIGSGNLIDSDRDTTRDGTTVTWSNVSGTKTQMGSPFSIPADFVITTDTADTAYTNVLNGAGATKPSRDPVDTRIVNDVINMTGHIINNPSDVGGWPTLASGTPPTDTDGDGMPDAWETAYGTNPNVPDNNGDLDGDGYTNLEEYLNSL
jgi:pectate lyase